MRRELPEGTCLSCRRPCTVGHRQCRACYRSATPETPIRRWCRDSRRSLEQLARATGLPLRSVKRAASGVPATTSNALALERVTGIALEVLLEGSAP
jgi:hypothetical protein